LFTIGVPWFAGRGPQARDFTRLGKSRHQGSFVLAQVDDSRLG
jgi:hypothetical protein